jgi:hypothetical protein
MHAAAVSGKLDLPAADAGGHRRVLAVLIWPQGS